MAISILHLSDRISNAEALSDRILYHLSLDRSFSHICADVNKREYFLSVLSDLTDDKNKILYRQDIVKDFVSNPTLLEQLEKRVAEHNNFARRLPVVEEQIKIVNHRIDELERSSHEKFNS